MAFLIETHFRELKYRLVFIALSFLITFLSLYNYSLDLIQLLTSSLERELIFTDLSESLVCQLEVSLIASFYLTIPFMIYQIKAFFKPGLYKSEVKFINKCSYLFIILYMIALVSSIGYLLPLIYNFLKSYESVDNVSTVQLVYLPRLRELLSFIYIFIMVFIIVFELPLILLVLYTWQIVSLQNLISFRKYNIMLSFVLGAIISPPDILSQVFIAAQITLLYEISIIMMLRLSRSRNFLIISVYK